MHTDPFPVVFWLAMSLELCAVQFATEAAITILRIDDMIKIEKGPEDEEMD